MRVYIQEAAGKCERHNYRQSTNLLFTFNFKINLSVTLGQFFHFRRELLNQVIFREPHA